jgi:formate hydrogenlyase subunit 3/multisubunit Na+/H+ antiporter MnhD subunit
MNIRLLFIAIIIIIAAIFSISTSSIGVECYNYDKPGKTLQSEKPSNLSFLVYNVVSAALMIVLGLISIYIGWNADPEIDYK